MTSSVRPIIRRIKNRVSWLSNYCLGQIHGNIVRAYWAGENNFGDALTPILLRYYGYTPVRSSTIKAEFVSVGTILDIIPDDFSGIILGAGMSNRKKFFYNAQVLGVRGYLTKENLGISKEIVIGDPGLLVSYIYPENFPAEWDLGIVPHMMDKKDKILKMWKNKFGDKVKIIDVTEKPSIVIENIKKCRNIISSSLHGLIVADAYSIPNIMFAIRSNRPEIFDYKYRDYYSSLGLDLKLIEVDGSESSDFLISKVINRAYYVTKVKDDLHKAYQNLEIIFKIR